jgi:hypothetical protein
LAVSLALIGVSARAQAVQRFDLLCSGTVTSTIDSSITRAGWSARARIDLGHGRLCLDDCADTRNVSVSRPSMIESLSLGRESPSPERVEYADRIDVDRQSGRYYRVHDWVETKGGVTSDAFPVMHRDVYSGSCALAQFSGFPPQQF